MDRQNHQLWMDTLQDSLKPFVSAAVERWNKVADEFNQWPTLGWDERTELVQREASCFSASLSPAVSSSLELR